jgi:hypothetical protein
MTVIDITIHQTFLPHDDPDASLTFDRDTLGFGVRNDVGSGGIRWTTVGPADQPGRSILLEPPVADPVGSRLVVPTVDFAPRRFSYTTVHTGSM